MIHAQNQKIVTITPPAAIVDNSAFTTAEIDTKGWDYAQIYVHLGATDIAMTALQVTEADVTNTSHVAITGLVHGTSDNIDGSTSAIPTSTADNDIICFDIDLKGRKRFIDLNATAGNGSAGTYMTAWCVLSRADAAPINMADRGCASILRV